MNFMFLGPFDLEFDFYSLPIADGRTDCKLALECKVEERDVEAFALFCEDRQRLDAPQLAMELYDSVRAAVVGVIGEYDFQDIVSGEAREKAAVKNRLLSEQGPAFAKKAVALVDLKSLPYENKEKEKEAKILEMRKGAEASNRLRELANARSAWRTRTRPKESGRPAFWPTRR